MRHLPPVPLILAFVNCINLRDLPGLVSLMSPDHRFQVFDEGPVLGRDVNEHAWAGYLNAYPSYLIYRISSPTSPEGWSQFSATRPGLIWVWRTPRKPSRH